MRHFRQLAVALLLLLPLATAQVAGAEDRSKYQVTTPPADVDDVIVTGTHGLVGPVTRKNAGVRDVTLNYPNVDVHEAAKSILGDLLGLNYFVDPTISGTVSVVTAEPVTRADVLPVFESALKGANLALVKRGGLYTIV